MHWSHGGGTTLENLTQSEYIPLAYFLVVLGGRFFPDMITSRQGNGADYDTNAVPDDRTCAEA